MSSKETHYNRKPESGNEEGGKEKGAGRKRQQLSPERAKDVAKKTRKAGTTRRDGEDRPARPPRDNKEGRSFNKKDDKPFERRERSEGGERKSFGDKKPFEKRGESRGGDKPFRSKREEGDRPYKPRTSEGGDKPFRAKREEGDRPYKPRTSEGGDKPFRAKREEGDRPYKPRTESGDKPFRAKREEGDRPYKPRTSEAGDKPFRAKREEGDRPFKPRSSEGGDKPFRPRKEDGDRPSRPRREDSGDKPFKKYIPFEDRKDKGTRPDAGNKFGKGPKGKFEDDKEEKPVNPFEGEDFYEDERPFTRSSKWNEQAKAGPMTLNKYLAHSGISSRREAAAIIKSGKVMVNGEVKTEPGYRVNEGDVITYDDKVMKPQKNLVYILLNKPKGFITTTDDEKGRRTVMDLVANAEADRIYPIGRLDRNTTGVLIMTNDGDLTQKLSHPSYNSKKIYQVTLTEPLTKRDFDKIVAGITLEDGPAPVDALAYLEKKNEVGIEIHNGKNRIVRRIFESLGYVVEKLDRVVFAGLTKKNVSRGKWRFLTEKEVILLKHFKG